MFFNIYKESKLIKREKLSTKKKLVVKSNRKQKKKNVKKNIRKIVYYCPTHHTISHPTTSKFYTKTLLFPTNLFRFSSSFFYLYFFSKFIFFKGVSHHITALLITLQSFNFFFCVYVAKHFIFA